MNPLVMCRWHGLKQLGACLAFCLPSPAQITYRLADHPTQVGVDTWKLRDDTSGKSITSLVGATGGPHRWDFSYQAAPNEAIRTMHIVAPNDGGHQASFPGATYAERETVMANGCQTWNYYRLTAGAGRIISGSYGACKTPQPSVVFEFPMVEYPDNLKFGDVWQQNTQWEDDIGGDGFSFAVLIEYANTSRVDAYGTLVLPGGIGEVPTLRVNEVTSYDTTLSASGTPLATQSIRNYYWLVPGIGRAVQLSSPAGTSAPPENFSTSRSIFRVFESSRYPLRQFVKNLSIARGGNQIFLAWDQEIGALNYEVEYSPQLAAAPWTLLGSPTGNLFSDTLGSAPARFYRVFWRK